MDTRNPSDRPSCVELLREVHALQHRLRSHYYSEVLRSIPLEALAKMEKLDASHAHLFGSPTSVFQTYGQALREVKSEKDAEARRQELQRRQDRASLANTLKEREKKTKRERYRRPARPSSRSRPQPDTSGSAWLQHAFGAAPTAQMLQRVATILKGGLPTSGNGSVVVLTAAPGSIRPAGRPDVIELYTDCNQYRQVALPGQTDVTCIVVYTVGNINKVSTRENMLAHLTSLMGYVVRTQEDRTSLSVPVLVFGQAGNAPITNVRGAAEVAWDSVSRSLHTNTSDVTPAPLSPSQV
ncbi:hypothetical protein KIPB_010282 [Kipferlia bialata]|uniref:Uncharacterized protein n=1 Tax=Kipferlia bialata TaxID=797122 RepID=A0A9K3GM91_9EUKA|nr:hypothetical protein KIPB_010282 [Kipferlia bialata]|eukprot:g10282.t1